MPRRYLYPAIVLAVALWLYFQQPAATALGPVPAYTGRATCARCHAAETEAYRNSHHDLAMQVATEFTVLGNFEGSTLRYNGVVHRFYRQGNRFLVNTDGPNGTMQDFEVVYTFGAEPLQQYLVATDRGRYQPLPFCWDSRPVTAGGQRWFHLYPDEAIDHRDALHWTKPIHNWNGMCADCHSTNLQRNYNRVTDTFDTTWSEIDVSCEACHGPGSNHVAWAEDPQADGPKGLLVTFGGPGTWTFAPGAVTASPQPRPVRTEIQTCAPCHSRRTVLDGRPWHGRPFLDSFQPALLDRGLYHADGQILDEVYVWGSFVQSAMHAAGVTCSDCHEPHGLGLRAQGNALCTRCHESSAFDGPDHHHHLPASPATSCVACHMPEHTYMVVDPRRDHSMRVPRPDLSVEIGTPNACNGCHHDQPAQWAAAAVRSWFPGGRHQEPHFGQVLHAGRTGAPGARAALRELVADLKVPGIVRGTGAVLLGEGLADGAGDDPDPLVRYGAAVGALPDQARRLLDDPIRLVRHGAARTVGDPSFLDVLALHRDRAWSHIEQAQWHRARGELTRAEAAYRQALILDPDAVRARVNLADLLREQGRDPEGEDLLRQGLTGDPRAAELLYPLGLLLVRTGHGAEALGMFRRAVLLRPEDPHLAFVYGVALHDDGQQERALSVLESAQRRHPWDPELLRALMDFHQERLNEASYRHYRQLLRQVSDR